MSNQDNLFRFVKVEGHANWFLLLERDEKEPTNFSDNMQERILRSEVCQLHNPNVKMDYAQRLVMTATRNIDYEELANKYGAILIRPIGSYMMLHGNTIIEECMSSEFPITEYGEIVICENDSKPENSWVKYLEKRFPNKKIVTINYFDLRSSKDVQEYFSHAEIITFSTTFSNMDWFKKLAKLAESHHKVIGFSHDSEKWEEAINIFPNVEIVQKQQ